MKSGGLAVDVITGWTGVRRTGAYLSYDGNSGLVTNHPLWRKQGSIVCPHFPRS
jgi:molybdopterin-synthase adenylyltransferase